MLHIPIYACIFFTACMFCEGFCCSQSHWLLMHTNASMYVFVVLACFLRWFFQFFQCCYFCHIGFLCILMRATYVCFQCMYIYFLFVLFFQCCYYWVHVYFSNRPKHPVKIHVWAGISCRGPTTCGAQLTPATSKPNVGTKSQFRLGGYPVSEAIQVAQGVLLALVLITTKG